MQMKKMVKIGLALCAVVLLASGSAWAAIGGSRHDVDAGGNPYLATLGALSEFGACSACHIPHGAGADRLFPSAPSGVAGGFFGPLCASCHTQVGFAGGGVNVWAQNSVYQTTAHGLDITGDADSNPPNLDGLGNHYSLASTNLAYMGTADSPRTPAVDSIECLSCHDVHNQRSNRPFLMVSLSTLCQECHTNRALNVVANSGFSNALSTHPAGPNFTGDMGNASGVANNGGPNSPIVWAPITNTDTGSNGSTWTDAVWNSGMHLETDGTNSGVGCVTCHNVHWDDNSLIANNTTFYLGVVGDDLNAGANNSFCEYCHQGTYQGTSAYFYNPGATSYTHPCDDIGSTIIDSAADIAFANVFVNGLPTSAAQGSAASGIVCTSCHGIHPGDDTASETEPNTPILAAYDNATYSNICEACHGASYGTGWNHHPVGDTAYATSGNTVGNLTCQGGDTEGFTTCHGGSTNGGSAHNRLNPLGRGINTNYSAMCVRCHTSNPSLYIPANNYTANGEASHFVGDAAAAGFGARSTGSGAVIRAAGDDTGVANWSGSGLPSKWGANNGVIICESCHRLASGNLNSGDAVGGLTAGTNMMIEVSGMAHDTLSTEASTNTGTDYTLAPYLCTGCHNIPSGTHPLLNATGATYPIPGTTGQAYTTAGFVNCESCHSAHTADTLAGSYILDDGTTSGTGTTGMEVEPTIDYTGFCAVCHATFQ